MNLSGWLLLIAIIQVVHFVGTWKFYVAAGRKAWEAAIPVYNAVVLLQILKRPWWWTLLLFIPIVNLIMFPVLWVELLNRYGKTNTVDTLLVIFTAGFYLYYINYTQELNCLEDDKLKKPNGLVEWVGSLAFAIVAATIVHTYVMQPFVIPTSSLEKTLLVGDFLFVSKFHFGARTPMTPIAMPMMHDVFMGTKAKSYLPKPQVPSVRLPGFEDIEHNDIVVFNWPVDEYINISQYRPEGPPPNNYQFKPVDKKSNYVKRCVGLPGDSLEVRDGSVFINGKQNELPDRAKLQFAYEIKSKSILVKVDSQRRLQPEPNQYFSNRYGVSDMYATAIDRNTGIYSYTAHLTEEAYQGMKNYPDVISAERKTVEKGRKNDGIFPHAPANAWNNDHFGPIYIPEAGKTVAITPESIAFYKRIIEVYEGSELGIDNTITQNGTTVLLNDTPITSYTFAMDYYWMMGDNRNNSQDARSWGYVPMNHVVGKPVFVWMSFNSKAKGLFNKIRWDRFFTTVSGKGETTSYFIPFLALLAGWIGFRQFQRRRRKKA
ncbi:MAG: signal peptidase I [Candidatus Paceibacteria bacterium]|jgi:signal peptidase I